MAHDDFLSVYPEGLYTDRAGRVAGNAALQHANSGLRRGPHRASWRGREAFQGAQSSPVRTAADRGFARQSGAG